MRLTLEEKRISWHSHHVELATLEHLTEEYQAIHPKGVVPALVHDGALYIESNDIIRYLDEEFPGDSLMPAGDVDSGRATRWMDRAAGLQLSIKTLTYDRIFRKRRPPDRDHADYYAKHQGNRELVDFHRQYAEGFDPELLDFRERQVVAFMSDHNDALKGRRYLAGDGFTLADISTVVVIHRTVLLGLDMALFEDLRQWYRRIADRPSFERAITAYQNKPPS